MGDPGLVQRNERGEPRPSGTKPGSQRSPVPGVDSAGRPNQCGA